MSAAVRPMTLSGYYAILDVAPPPSGTVPESDDQLGDHGPILQRAARLLAGTPCMLQLRAKTATAAALAALARAILPLARAAGVPFCVNDRLDIALAVGADAVHLGQDDLPLAEARLVARGRLRIGVSTHSLAQARAAVAGGADYIGVGPIFPTVTKANPDPVVGLATLEQVCKDIGASGHPGPPVVAIGGITLDRVGAVAMAGAAAAALIAAMDRAADPVHAALAVNAAFRGRGPG